MMKREKHADHPQEAAWEMTAEQEKADRAKSAQERFPEINMSKPTSKLPTPAGGQVPTTLGIRG